MVSLSPPWRIGVDVGGTFTDVVVADCNGRLLVKKSTSLPSDPTQGILRALATAATEAALTLRRLLS